MNFLLKFPCVNLAEKELNGIKVWSITEKMDYYINPVSISLICENSLHEETTTIVCSAGRFCTTLSVEKVLDMLNKESFQTRMDNHLKKIE